MARSKIVSCDYYQFTELLRRAGNAGQRIEKKDPRWAEYVKTHGINEVASFTIAQQKFDKPDAVIIAEGKDTDGLYFYSRDEEACLRLMELPA